jgi:hypothetical protein
MKSLKKIWTIVINSVREQVGCWVLKAKYSGKEK